MDSQENSSSEFNADQTKPINNSDDIDTSHRGILEYAWQLFATYDQNAIIRRKQSIKMGNRIFLSTILLVFLVIVSSLLKQSTWSISPLITNLVRILVIFAPIAVSMLVAFASSFGGYVPRTFLQQTLGQQKGQATGTQNDRSSSTSESEYLRRASGQIETHIMLYRMKLGKYADETKRDMVLASEINKIEKKLMQETPIQNIGLTTYRGNIPPFYFQGDPYSDPGFGDINGDQYIKYRIENLLAWYSTRVLRVEEQKRRNTIAIIFFGGLGTFLAAIGLEIWVTLTTAVAGASASVLESAKIDQTINEYNKVISELSGLNRWWFTLPPEEKQMKNNLENLVMNSEKVIIGEQSWNDINSGEYSSLTTTNKEADNV